MKRWALVWGLILGLSLAARAQQGQDEVYRAVDEIIQPQPEGLPDLEDFSENVFRFLVRPLDLNRAGADDFRLLPFLTEIDIERILAHRAHYGRFENVEELQAVDGLALAQARRLRHYCIIEQDQGLAGLLPNLFQVPNHSLTLRAIARSDRRRDGRYAGGPLQWYGRYRLARPGAYSIGIIAEKDPGEAGLAWKPGRGVVGPDYLSAHIMIENKGGFKRLILGDYALSFGQGLVFAQGFTLGQNAQTVTSLKKRSQGARPYTSALEGRQLRGLCALKAIGPFEATVFASRKQMDATVTQPADTLSDGNPFPAFRTIRSTGLHRTEGEQAGQGLLTEDLLGGQLQYKNRSSLNSIGLTAMASRYSQPINPTPRAYNGPTFRGDRLWVTGLHYSQTWRNLCFFGESAVSNGKAWGHYHGVMAALSEKVDVGLSYRAYSAAYTAPYAAGFGHTSLTANERGLYLGMQVRPTRSVTVNGAFDLYRKPWLAYRMSRPEAVSSSLIRATWQPTRQMTLYLQAQQSRFERDLPLEVSGTFKAPEPVSIRQWMGCAEISPAERWVIRTRIQTSHRQGTGLKATNGSAIAQDISYEGRWMRISGRLTAFSVDDADNRIYLLERNVLGAYSFTQLNGKGTRAYVLVSVRPTPQLDLWVRVARTRYANPIESLAERPISSITEISLQARIWLSPQKINLF